MTLQHLTPAQRAILLLREVLGWDARTVAEWLDLSVPAVNSALQRARRVLRQRQHDSEAPLTLDQPNLQALLDRYVALWEQGDIVALLREDAWFTMPPRPIWYQGRAAIAAMLAARIFTPGRQRRLLSSHANGAPAFGIYQREPGADNFHLLGLMVVEVAGEQIGNMVAFMDLACLAPFALPPSVSIYDASA